jgi:hypothetical protein
MRVTLSRRRWIGALLCAAVVATAPALVRAQTPVAPPPDAKALLLKMADFLGKSQRFSVTMRGSYDAMQASGQKIEWNDLRTLVVSRPDRLRMEAEKSNGARTLVIFDGKEVTTFDEVSRSFARVVQPGGIDETLVYFLRDLGMRLPLGALFTSRAASDLERRVTSVEYVEKTGILGSPAHHLVGRTDSVNFQVWISDGEQPLPQRIVLTYPNAPGQPEFRAQFVSWNLAPDVADKLFTFTPPSGANRIPFVAGLQKYAPARAGDATKKGTK